MLANVDVLGQPIACARFMGGREFEEICRLTAANLDDALSEPDIEILLREQVFPIPPFVPRSGPFRNSVEPGRIMPATPAARGAATLYLALMLDYELSLLGSTGSALLGSASRKNPLLCSLLAQLRPHQDILVSNDDASTVKGAWCLTRWQRRMPGPFYQFEKVQPASVPGLLAYRDRWRSLLPEQAEYEH
jgi:hypothetical protein